MSPAKRKVTKRASLTKARCLQLQMARLRRESRSTDGDCCTSTKPGPSTVVTDQAPTSAFARKRKLFQQTFNDDAQTNGQSSNFIIIDSAILNDLVLNLRCPSCSSAGIKIVQANSELGFTDVLSTECVSCGTILNTTRTSRRTGSGSGHEPFEVNRRIVAAFLEMGTGYAGLETFCRVMNMKYLHQKSFNAHANEICSAAVKTCEETLKQSTEIVRKAYLDLYPDLLSDDIIDISVSYDASWMKRGHTSHFGVGTCIDLLTGLIIDYEVMSSFCKKCSTSKSKMTSEEFENWYLTHKDQCDINYEGSAGAMEVKAAANLWMRSSVRNKLRYTVMLSDGDSKTFLHLQHLQPYGEDHPVLKEECINHVSKRMGTALRKLAKESRGKGIVLGGRGWGRLTDDTINKLTAYYGKAIRNNVDDVDGMRAAVFATFLHSISTDEDPHHSRCPQGSNSWCFYNRALAAAEKPGSHRENVGTPLNRDVAEHVKIVYERLGDPGLLSRCLRGKTQNANESFHSIIWKFCPKTSFLSRKRVVAGVAQAVMQFNKGKTSSESLLKELFITPGKNMEEAGQKKDAKRLRNSLRSNTRKKVAQNISPVNDSSYASGAY